MARPRSLSQYRTFAEWSRPYILDHKSFLSSRRALLYLDNFQQILRRRWTPTARRPIEKFGKFSNSDAMLLSKMCYPLAKRSRNTYETFQHQKQFCTAAATAHPFVVMDTDTLRIKLIYDWLISNFVALFQKSFLYLSLSGFV